ncbi:SDR family oxidoreductase [Mesoterricola silvestris]|uniref:NAD(P)-dependent oxidoreductase n=1 Tax=Mesoterricola silvestris TaxID=2927979 RepID=A0AA48GLQ2_9BACT|nr:SDR family oxidoreductase [Mesoterricola silvestris]BDU73599.1 NAD(P)-dependent oxidoreductase [Mesoterricola silvestris]
MIAITGASGQLGRLVIQQLLRSIPASGIVALARKPESVRDLGVQARPFDYERPGTLAAALAGVDKLLLISSSEVGRRTPQHKAVIDAARAAGVKLVAYTSLLHAPQSPLGLAPEHVETEAHLKASGLPFVLLRNGWYTENYTASIPSALAHGAFLGSAGAGRIASAARADYAAAAAAVLLREDQAGKTYELAGDIPYTLTDLAAEIARQSGKPVAYQDLPEAEFKAVLVGAGLPEGLAALLADSDAGAAKGALLDEGRQLSRLLGRATTPMADSVAAFLKG